MSKEKKREMLIQRGDDTFARILANHSNPEAFPLTVTETEQLDRWHECFTLLLNHWSKPKVVKRWVSEKGLSTSQAYADIRNAESLYGNVLKADKEGFRAKWLLWTEESLLRCLQKGDEKGVHRALSLLGKYGQLDKFEDETVDPDKYKNVEIKFDLSKNTLEALEKFTKGGVQDFNDFAVDIEHEIIPQDE